MSEATNVPTAPDALAAGLEVGTSRTACWIGEGREDSIHVRAIGEARSEGVRAGEVVDVRAAAGSIRSAIEEAEAQSGLAVESVYVALAGAAVAGTKGRAAAPILREGQEINVVDVRRVLERAGAVGLPPGAMKLHVLPQSFTVDGAGPIRDPVGLTGAVLEADVVVLSGSAFAAENMSRAVRLAGRHVASVIAAPAAVGLGALSDEERDLGALVLDIGAGTTDFAAWCRGELTICGCVPAGGELVTRDIAVGIGTSREVAEALKRESSTAHPRSLAPDEARRVVRAPSLGGGEPRSFTRAELGEIAEARIEEILLLILRRLGGCDPVRDFGAGVVVAGGGAGQIGIEAKARDIIGVRARAAHVRFDTDLPKDIARPEHALGAGLIWWASGGRAADGVDVAARPLRWFTSAVRWLAAGF
jgi:cell division protein FtsA